MKFIQILLITFSINLFSAEANKLDPIIFILDLSVVDSKIPAIEEVLSKRIEDLQHFILKTHCKTPAVLGGDLL